MLFESIDLFVATFDHLGGHELFHLDDQNVFVMRAVEDTDEALRRNRFVDAPEIVVRPFLLGGGLERGDGDSDRPAFVEYRANGAILAAAVYPLQHDEQGSLAFGK